MEQDLRECKQCNIKKLRIRSGKYPSEKDTKFVDNEGKIWNGNICPECHNENRKAYQKEKRRKAKQQD